MGPGRRRVMSKTWRYSPVHSVAIEGLHFLTSLAGRCTRRVLSLNSFFFGGEALDDFVRGDALGLGLIERSFLGEGERRQQQKMKIRAVNRGPGAENAVFIGDSVEELSRQRQEVAGLAAFLPPGPLSAQGRPGGLGKDCSFLPTVLDGRLRAKGCRGRLSTWHLAFGLCSAGILPAVSRASRPRPLVGRTPIRHPTGTAGATHRFFLGQLLVDRCQVLRPTGRLLIYTYPVCLGGFACAVFLVLIFYISLHSADGRSEQASIHFRRHDGASSRVGEPLPSPDGKWVLFSVVDVNREANHQNSACVDWFPSRGWGNRARDYFRAERRSSRAGRPMGKRFRVPVEQGGWIAKSLDCGF